MTISFLIRLHGGIDRVKDQVKESGILRFTSHILVRDIIEHALLLSGAKTHSFADKGIGPLSLSRTQHHKVKPSIRILQNIHIPTSALPPRPAPTRRERHRDSSQGEKIRDADDDDALEDWNERASELFEWIGMVNIGAQRYVLRDVVPEVMIT